MSLEDCARIVERGDPDRYLAVLAAPVAARARLLPLYAFNLEVARIPWVTGQPLIAEMRLQFWQDVLDDPHTRAHEVAQPLRQVISATSIDINLLRRMVKARHWDVAHAPHADALALAAYIEDTAAGLMWAAAQSLGAEASAQPDFRALGWAAGLASYLRAVPQLTAAGRQPLPDPGAQAVAALARAGLAKLDLARKHRRAFGAAAPAALAGWQAGPILAQARAAPDRVAEGTLGLSEFARRGRLLWMASSGRF